MGLIKKHYQKILSFGLVIVGIIAFIFVLILHPQKVSVTEAYDSNTDPKLTEISFPFSQDIPINTAQIDYLEVYFGDDSINNYEYTVSVTKNHETLFEHTYTDETSNIIRIPLAEINLVPNNDIITLQISCDHSCSNTQFELYGTKDSSSLKTLIFSHSTDYRYFWYSIFPILIGLTLIPLTKEYHK